MTPVILDGSKPLWGSFAKYLEFVAAHMDDLYKHFMGGDENADLIVTAVTAIGEIGNTENRRAVLMIAVERFISQHYPEIAHIEAKG